jgi:hypothetical protein
MGSLDLCHCNFCRLEKMSLEKPSWRHAILIPHTSTYAIFSITRSCTVQYVPLYLCTDKKEKKNPRLLGLPWLWSCSASEFPAQARALATNPRLAAAPVRVGRAQHSSWRRSRLEIPLAWCGCWKRSCRGWRGWGCGWSPLTLSSAESLAAPCPILLLSPVLPHPSSLSPVNPLLLCGGTTLLPTGIRCWRPPRHLASNQLIFFCMICMNFEQESTLSKTNKRSYVPRIG